MNYSHITSVFSFLKKKKRKHSEKMLHISEISSESICFFFLAHKSAVSAKYFHFVGENVENKFHTMWPLTYFLVAFAFYFLLFLSRFLFFKLN